MKEVIEGLLYMQGDSGLSVKDIADILEINLDKAKELILELKSSYENQNRGLRIVCLGNNYKITTRSEDNKYIRKLINSDTNRTLSNQALEVLAIIAYNEPITRLEVDNLRGVDSAYIIRKLLAKELIKEAGKKDAIGKPTLYKTTSCFLDYFGLSSLDELPKIKVPAEENIEENKDLFTSIYKENE